MNLLQSLDRDQPALDAEDGIFAGHIVMMSYYADRTHAPRVDHAPSALPVDARPSRYSDQPMTWQTRLFGLGSTAFVAMLIVAGVLFTWKTVQHITSTSPSLVVMELAPLEAPADPVREVAPGPEQVERREAEPQVEQLAVPEPLVQLPAPSVVHVDTRKPAEITDPGPSVPETTAPRSIVAPSTTRLSNDARPTWEAQLLTHLERFRRYPARARAARQQGTVYIEFRMNRAGNVLSASVLRSSGSPSLDQAALDTLKRAQPLPPIPEDRPDVVELTVPVEFYIGR